MDVYVTRLPSMAASPTPISAIPPSAWGVIAPMMKQLGKALPADYSCSEDQGKFT